MQTSQKRLKWGAVSLAAAGALSMSLTLAPSPALAEEVDGGVITATEGQQDTQAIVEEQIAQEVPAATQDTQQAVVEDTVDEGATEVAGATEEGTETDAAVTEEPAATEVTETEATETEVVETETEAAEAEITTQNDEEKKSNAPALPSKAVEVVEGTYVMQSVMAPENIIDAAGVNPTNGANVGTWSFNNGDNQKWIVEKVYEDSLWYRLFLKKDPTLVLTAAGDGGAMSNVQVNKKTNDDDKASLWSFVDAGSGAVKLVNALKGLCFDIANNNKALGANILLWYDKDGECSNQCFNLVDAAPSVEVSTSTTAYEGAWNLQVKGTDLLADIDHGLTTNGADLLLWVNNGGTNQKIYLEADGKGYYKVWNVGTGKLLDVAYGSVLPGSNVLQWENNGGSNQLWAVYQATDGTWTLRNKGTGLWLGTTAPKLGASLKGLSTGSAFKATATKILTAGIKEIHPQSNTGMNIDINNAATTSGANALLWFDTDALNQRFELVSAGDNKFRIRTASSGGWLCDNGLAKSVTQQGSSATKSSADVWRVSFAGGGIGLINESTGRALDIYGGNTAAFTSVCTWYPTGAANQHFVFNDADLFNPGIYFVGNKNLWTLDIDHAGTAANSNVVTWVKTNAQNQKFRLVKSGAGWQIISTNSNRAIGSTSAQHTSEDGSFKYHNVEQQGNNIWKACIGDGGYIEFINATTGENLVSRGASASQYNVISRDIEFGSSTASSGRSWKLSAAAGWMIVDNTWHYFNDAGERITRDGYAAEVVNHMIRPNQNNGYFNYRYFVSTSIPKCRTIVWENLNYGTGRAAEWVPKFDWLAGTSLPEDATHSEAVGWFRFGGSNGEPYSGGPAASGANNGRSPSCWGVRNVIFLWLNLAYHSTGASGAAGASEVGKRVSHGCIRLMDDCIQWLYNRNNTPNGTGTVVYNEYKADKRCGWV